MVLWHSLPSEKVFPCGFTGHTAFLCSVEVGISDTIDGIDNLQLAVFWKGEGDGEWDRRGVFCHLWWNNFVHTCIFYNAISMTSPHANATSRDSPPHLQCRYGVSVLRFSVPVFSIEMAMLNAGIDTGWPLRVCGSRARFSDLRSVLHSSRLMVSVRIWGG